MTLRDWFAGQAIGGAAYMLGVSGADQELADRRTLVATAYAIADDMLAQRALHPTQQPPHAGDGQ
jgi:hypothetical protein